MLVTRAPYRISLFGGGTDFPEWFGENSGAVISFTIDKYCWITARRLPRFFPHKSRIVWSEIELVNEIESVRHPSARECLKSHGIDDVEIHYDGDLPGSSGMGSSSAFTVALLMALHALNRKMVSKTSLADEAIDIERNVLGEAGGWQDQIASSFGGFNHIRFEGDAFSVSPIIASRSFMEMLCSWGRLYFLGMARKAADVSKVQADRIEDNTERLALMNEITSAAKHAIMTEDFSCFAYLLREQWELKKRLSPIITNDDIDSAYDAAIKAGAVGAKLLGAGGGGFLFVFRPPHKADDVSQALGKYKEVDFSIDTAGSSVVYYGEH